MKKNSQPSRRNGKSAPFAMAALAAVALAACGNGSEPSPATDVRPAATGATKTAAAVNAPATLAPAASLAPAPASPPATTGPNGRSPVPSTADWTAETKEVGVKGSGKLGCETKMIREWLRVSCRGKNDTGGEAKGVTLKKGGGKGDTFTFASGGVASLVCPFVDGIDIAAEFEWADKKMELVVRWPHGAPMPPMKGEFR